MGTSSSYRAPSTPRWSAFVAALAGGESLDRVRSELFNAGAEWQAALAAPPVAAYAGALAEVYSDLGSRLESADRADLVVGAVVAEAKAASLAAGFTPALAIAERAFATTIMSALAGVTDGPPAEAAGRWAAARGDAPADLIAKFAGEVVAQYTRHVVDREAGRLATEGSTTSVAGSTSRALAETARVIGAEAAIESLRGSADVRVWALVVNRAFEQGRALPPAAKG